MHITFVDHEGRGPSCPAGVGMTVSEVAELHGIDIGPTAVAGVVERVNSDVWTEDLFGEGASLGYDHVKVPPAWAAKLPPRGAWELELLRNCWDDDDITSVSRLGSQLPLTKGRRHPIYIPDGKAPRGNLWEAGHVWTSLTSGTRALEAHAGMQSWELPARAAQRVRGRQNSPSHWFGLCDTCRAETRIAAALLAERAKLSKRWLANASTET